MPKLSGTELAQVTHGGAIADAHAAQPATQPFDSGRKIAELAMIVLDACDITLSGNIIELSDGQIVADAFAVRCFKELRKLAGQYGITQEEVAAQVNAEVAKQFEDLFAEGHDVRGNMGSTEDSDRKGVFR